MYGRALTLSAILLIIITAFGSCKSNRDGEAEEKAAPLTINGNTDVFNESFTRLLTAYYALKDAFVANDTVKINAAAASVLLNSGGLKISEIKGDSTGMISETAKHFTETINGSADALQAEPDIEAKRREFYMITDAMWSLTRTVRYEGQKVYYHFCQSSLDNSGAYWLSDNKAIRNPYSAENATPCGEVTDSLDYSKR